MRVIHAFLLSGTRSADSVGVAGYLPSKHRQWHTYIHVTKTKKWAADLEALCAETADERTCLEATAYSAWMSGNLLLEKEAWREALERYSTAHRICQELGKVGDVTLAPRFFFFF